MRFHANQTLKPTSDNTVGALRRLALSSQSKDRAIDIYFPARMMKIDLHRTYRTTQNIFPLFKTVLDVLHNHTNAESSALGNSDSCDPRPGHGIIGELTEILIHPNCGCWFYCTNPTEHLLEKYSTVQYSTVLKLIVQIFVALESSDSDYF